MNFFFSFKFKIFFEHRYLLYSLRQFYLYFSNPFLFNVFFLSFSRGNFVNIYEDDTFYGCTSEKSRQLNYGNLSLFWSSFINSLRENWLVTFNTRKSKLVPEFSLTMTKVFSPKMAPFLKRLLRLKVTSRSQGDPLDTNHR